MWYELFTLNNELETNSKNNIRYFNRGISDFKKGYQCRITLVKDYKGDTVAPSHSILMEESVQLLNVNGVSNVRQTEIAKPLVPEPIVFEVDMAVEELKSHKSPGIDQSPAELIKTRGRTIHSEIHKLIYSFWNMEELPEE